MFPPRLRLDSRIAIASGGSHPLVVVWHLVLREDGVCGHPPHTGHWTLEHLTPFGVVCGYCPIAACLCPQAPVPICMTMFHTTWVVTALQSDHGAQRQGRGQWEPATPCERSRRQSGLTRETSFFQGKPKILRGFPSTPPWRAGLNSSHRSWIVSGHTPN